MKIPKNAKLVYKGIIFDVYQWQQKMYDGSTETFEMLKRTDTVLVLPTVGKKILLAYQKQPHRDKPFYSLFGGRLEEGEDHLEGVKRELSEESGYISNDWQLYKKYEPFGKMDWEVLIYVARDCKKVTDQKLDPGEQIEIREFTLEELIDHVSSDEFWGGEFALDLIRMSKNPEKLEQFRKKLFKP